MSTPTAPTAARHPSASPVSRGREWASLIPSALAVWMGVHALRSFWSMIVWNVAEDRSPPQIALIALVFWAIGLLAWLATRWFGGPEPALRFGGLFALAYVANQAVSHYLLTPALGIAAGVLWLWFLPALIIGLARRGSTGVLMSGILLGLAAQVALQTALHGLDMPVLHGIRPGIIGLLLAAALYASLRAAVGSVAGTPRAQGGEAAPGWGLAALGPYLLLQFTLLTNPGRIAALTGWDLAAAAGYVLLGLVVAVAVLLWSTPPTLRGIAGLLAVIALTRPAWLTGNGIWLLFAAQVFVTLAMAAALAPAPGGRSGRVFGGIVVAAMLFFVMMFLYYRRYGWPELWSVMAALAVLPAILTRPTVTVGAARQALAATLVVAVVGVALSYVGPRRPTVASVAPAELKVLDYNIHEIFNVWSVPDPEAVARVIEQSGADLVGLQEVGRGWNINGGPDLVAWLRWRFPQYRVIFTPLLGDLVGIAILSRYPVPETGSLRYAKRKSRLPFGLQWATIPTAAGDLFFTNTHLSPYPGFEQDRLAQANDLLKFWLGRDRTIVVGDFNAGPEEEAIKLILAAGLVDVSAAHGLAEAFTSPSADPSDRRDYIFSSREVESLAAAIPQTAASDHLPFEARVRLR